jgi:hypothetical protein
MIGNWIGFVEVVEIVWSKCLEELELVRGEVVQRGFFYLFLYLKILLRIIREFATIFLKNSLSNPFIILIISNIK